MAAWRIWPSPPQSPARFEFRCWGSGLGAARAGLERQWHRQGDTAETDVYYLGGTPDLSLKSRTGQFQVKERIARDGALEQWDKVTEIPFPVGLDEVLPWLRRTFGKSIPDQGEGTMSQAGLEAWLDRLPAVTVATVDKRRTLYELSVLRGEYTEIMVAGRETASVAVESTDAAAVDWARRSLDLADCTNESYPAALSRLFGLTATPG